MIERVERILAAQGLKVSVKSGTALGEESKHSDWIVLAIWPPGPITDNDDVPVPSDDWFQDMQTRIFESEREVEYYFILPMLEKMGYTYDDFAIGYSVDIFKGYKKLKLKPM